MAEISAAAMLQTGSIVQIPAGMSVSMWGFDQSVFLGPAVVQLTEPVQVVGTSPNVMSIESTMGMVLNVVDIGSSTSGATETYGEGYRNLPIILPPQVLMVVQTISSGSTLPEPPEPPVTPAAPPVGNGNTTGTTGAPQEESWLTRNWKAILILGLLGVGIIWYAKREKKESPMLPEWEED